ncbi:MAG: DUF3307 domain-containing protein [Planctomycetaceae bacterium]|nr:DUF3307 domain-containing protein [Planctomycetaceae bacterium]
MDAELLLRLVIAHTLADFFLQPRYWLVDRRRRLWRSRWLYVHGAVHTALAWAALGESALLGLALTVGATHVAIDVVKAMAGRAGQTATWFVVDQLLHALVLVAIADHVGVLRGFAPLETVAPTRHALAIVAGALVLSRPTSFLIAAFMSRWSAPEVGDATSLREAGKWIGLIERQLILLFVLTNNLPAVGFLIAAKSVFRFGELKDTGDRRRTEYVLIGTLLSFGLAMGVSMAIHTFLDLAPKAAP